MRRSDCSAKRSGSDTSAVSTHTRAINYSELWPRRKILSQVSRSCLIPPRSTCRVLTWQQTLTDSLADKAAGNTVRTYPNPRFLSSVCTSIYRPAERFNRKIGAAERMIDGGAQACSVHLKSSDRLTFAPSDRSSCKPSSRNLSRWLLSMRDQENKTKRNQWGVTF